MTCPGTFVPAEHVQRYGLAAVMLAQLEWLYREAKHVAWVRRDGVDWVAYADSDWEAVIGLGDRQARRARQKLVEAGVLECSVHKVDGIPTTHLRLLPTFAGIGESDSPESASETAEIGESLDSPKSANPPLYETEETTTETTTRSPDGDGLVVPYDEECFNATWALYPRKERRKAALKAWRARIKAGADPDALHRATQHYAATREGTDPKYTLHGATFYGPDDPWEDYTDGPPSGMTSGPRRRERKESPLERSLRLLEEKRAGRPASPDAHLKELTR